MSWHIQHSFHIFSTVTTIQSVLWLYFTKSRQPLVFKKYNMGINLIDPSSFTHYHMCYILCCFQCEISSWFSSEKFSLDYASSFPPCRLISDMNCGLILLKIVSFFCMCFFMAFLCLTLIFFLYFSICDLNHLNNFYYNFIYTHFRSSTLGCYFLMF